MKKEINVREFGFNSDYIATINQFGNYEWTDKYSTMWEYDPETDKSRHCGIGPGCFWTDWT